jgi:adenylate cyclase
MADIFISYSSKDREKAEQLTELLSSAGLSVWIDQSGIDIATSWSKEIVQAITGCKAFVILLSPNSILSENVAKEVSLAAERKKKILPLDLEPVSLPDELAYHLAGLQRAPMTNIDSIIRALGKLGLEATQTPTLKLVKETDSRKSLMILPFEDLSPTADNQWFADGLAAELISALSNVKLLKVTDQQTTKEYKSYKGHLTVYAKEMSIRYFIQGSVRKFGDQIKITSSLLDIETGDHLWQDSLKGTMDDIFDIQEKVAEKVVEGLKVHLASDEKKKLAERGTENAEAYEFFIKAREYFNRHTKEGYEHSIALSSDAISLDPKYLQAITLKAASLTGLYGGYSLDQSLLDEAELLCAEIHRIDPNFHSVLRVHSEILMHRGKLEGSEAMGKDWILKEPQNFASYYSLGYFYAQTGQFTKMVEPFEECVRLNTEDLNSLLSLVYACEITGEIEKCKYWASIALTYYERYLKLHPDDEDKAVRRAMLLHICGRDDEARTAAKGLKNLRDAKALYNTSCLFVKFGEHAEALHILRRALEAGYKNFPFLKEFLNEDSNGLASLAGTPEYEEMKGMVEVMEKQHSFNG